MSEMDDKIVEEFLADSLEGLDRLDRDLIELEKDPSSTKALGRAFRTLHTIKGTCSFFGYARLERVSHAGEGLLSRLRAGELAFSPLVVSALLGVSDAVRRILGSIAGSRSEGDVDDSALIAQVEQLHGAAVPTRAASAPVGPKPPAPAAATAPGTAPVAPADDDTDGMLPPDPRTGAPRGNVRVDVRLLDQLVNLVGELVLARNQVVQFQANDDAVRLGAATQRLSQITTQLQEEMMRTRMQPIAALWTRLPRIVHDVATACGKDVRLEMEGTHTELDKTIVEAIRDPLTHLVRNAIDHGVEPASLRTTLGKPAQGCIRLRAFQEGGQVVVEIADDGAGLPVERIRQKAIDRGLLTAERAAQLSERELLAFIFVPGFSTAQRVTSISGRGVGMDVVRANVERIGGSIDVASRAGEGTTVRLQIPLTLAIIPALLVRSADESYAIPQVNLIELLSVDGRDPNVRIEPVHGAHVCRLRGELLPLLWLREQLDGQASVAAPAAGGPRNVVVLACEGRRLGLVVDDVQGTEEIVVKPLSERLRGAGAFSGATILGDGRLALILDLPGLVRRAGLPAAVERAVAPSADAWREASRDQYVVAQLRDRWCVAMSLAHVSRLERIAIAEIERLGDQRVVRRLGQVIPLFALESLLDPGARPPLDGRTHVPAIVCAFDGRPVGLVVDAIDDIVDECVSTGGMSGFGRPGIAGCVVVRGRITDLVDVRALLERRVPDCLSPGAEAA